MDYTTDILPKMMQRKLTWPISKVNSSVSRAESVLQQLLLKANDWPQHGIILDLSGRDHNAAVHEISDGIGDLLVTLCQVCFQAEYLLHRSLVSTVISSLPYLMLYSCCILSCTYHIYRVRIPIFFPTPTTFFPPILLLLLLSYPVGH